MNRSVPWYTSWIAIILGMFLFPLGLILLLLRVVKDREINYTSGRTIRGFGTLIILFVLFIIIINIANDTVEQDVIIGLLVILGIPALIIRSIGSKSIRKGDRYARYIDAVYTRGVRSIHQLGGMFNQTPGYVLNDINAMRSRGLFPGSRLQDYILYLPQDIPPIRPVPMPSGAYPQQVMAQVQQAQVQQAQYVQQYGKQVPIVPPVVKGPKKVQCNGCGNTVVIKDGQVLECEFCGNHITYD